MSDVKGFFVDSSEATGPHRRLLFQKQYITFQKNWCLVFFGFTGG